MTHDFIFFLFEVEEKLIWPICSRPCLENLIASQTPAIHAPGMTVFPHANYVRTGEIVPKHSHLRACSCKFQIQIIWGEVML